MASIDDLRQAVVASLRDHQSDLSGSVQRTSEMAAGVALGVVPLSVQVMESGRSIERTLASFGSMFGAELAEIAVALTSLLEKNDSIEQALRNPRSVSAAESYRRGMNCAEQGWLDDAQEEFEAAVRDDKYFAPNHACLGLVQLSGSGSPDAAVRSFALACRYGLRDFPEIAAGAALVSISVLTSLQDTAAAVHVLNSVREIEDQCPDLLFRRFLLEASTSSLHRALALAPEFAALIPLPWNDETCVVVERLIEPEGGPVGKAMEILSLLTDIQRDYGNERLPKEATEILGMRNSIAERPMGSHIEMQALLVLASEVISTFRQMVPMLSEMVDRVQSAEHVRFREASGKAEKLHRALYLEPEKGSPFEALRRKQQLGTELQAVRREIVAPNPTNYVAKIQALSSTLRHLDNRLVPWRGPNIQQAAANETADGR